MTKHRNYIDFDLFFNFLYDPEYQLLDITTSIHALLHVYISIVRLKLLRHLDRLSVTFCVTTLVKIPFRWMFLSILWVFRRTKRQAISFCCIITSLSNILCLSEFFLMDRNAHSTMFKTLPSLPCPLHLPNQQIQSLKPNL